jgi:hypothetical protein
VVLRENSKRQQLNPSKGASQHILKKEGRVQSWISDCAKTFRELLERSTVIADRTIFLEELMNCSLRIPTMMFCLPMGVGKTMLLTMAHEFFGIKTKAETETTKKLFNLTFEGG